MKNRILPAGVVMAGVLAGLLILGKIVGCSAPPAADTAAQSAPSSRQQALPSAFEVHRIIINENLAILRTIKDDQAELTLQQAEAIKILGVYRCGDAVPLLAKHVKKDLPFDLKTDTYYANADEGAFPVSLANDPASRALKKIGMPTVKYIVATLNRSQEEPIQDTRLASLAAIANEILPHFREYFQVERRYAPLEAEKTYDRFMEYVTLYSVPPDKKTPTTMPVK